MTHLSEIDPADVTDCVEIDPAEHLDVPAGLKSLDRVLSYRTSDPSDVLLPPSVAGTSVEASLQAAVSALVIYGQAVHAAMQAIEKDRWTFLEAAYVLWCDLKNKPKLISDLATEYKVKVTGHKRGPFNTIIKILHKAAGIESESIQFAFYHGKLLERCHEHFCREAGLEAEPTSTPPFTPGSVVAVLESAGSVRGAVKQLKLAEADADRQARIDAERIRVEQWLLSGPKITASLTREDKFDPDAPSFLCVLAKDAAGIFRLKIIEDAQHGSMFRHTKNWEDDNAPDAAIAAPPAADVGLGA